MIEPVECGQRDKLSESIERHARLGPSNHRWPHCAGSVREESGYEDVAGAAAIDGTGSHLLLELCLINGVRAEAYDGQIIGANDVENPNGWLVDEERYKRVQECLDYVMRRHAELTAQYPGCTITVIPEGRANPGDLYGRTDWWGTCDITIEVYVHGECVFIEVCDYKDGRGYVHVPENSQLISYLGGRLKPFIVDGQCSVRDTRYTIVQPKTNTSVRYEIANVHTVMGLLNDMAVAAFKTDDPDAPVVPGKHCQWCKANPKRGGHCTAESSQSLQVVSSMGKDVIATDGQSLFELVSQSMANLATFTPGQLSELSGAESGMMAIFDNVRKEIERRIDVGEHVSGWAMTPGNSSSVWVGEQADIVKSLKSKRLKQDEIFPKKMISVPQVMKLSNLTDKQKKDIEAKFVVKKAGKLSLSKVAHSDVSVVEKDITAMFGDVIQSETNALQSESDVLKSAPSVFNDDPVVEVEEISFF